MPIKKRTAISKDTFVYLDPKGHLQIKTPASCTRWDQSFRLRIVRDYIAPRTLRPIAEHHAATLKSNNGDVVYEVGGKKLRVRHPVDNIDEKNYLVVLRTDVQNLTDGTQLFLNHDTPAMRILMVYAYLTGKTIGGVPDLQIAAIP